MRVALLARSTLYSVFGGDTVQITATAKYLQKAGIKADIRLANEQIDYKSYDLLHVFNVIRPADSLKHVRQSGKPYVLSTIYVDFSEYERLHRGGLARLAGRVLSGDQLEYLKAIVRQIKNGEKIQSPEYLLMGHRRSVKKLAAQASMLLPNSLSEMKRFEESYGVTNSYKVIYNGLDEDVFSDNLAGVADRDGELVLCVARIEGKKNQLNLIKALNNTRFRVKIVGRPAPNHIGYYDACRSLAAPNISFEGFVPQTELSRYYQQAGVHILPSWNETCGLSSLEAAYYGCNIVITDKGDTREYYGNDAWYCNPDDPDSIRAAVEQAAGTKADSVFRQKIADLYNWRRAAIDTLSAYETVLASSNL